MTVTSVLVPTYRRPEELRRCLDGLTRQQLPPDEVLVVLRPEDQPSHDVADEFRDVLPMRIIEVQRAGQVAALNAGREAARGDIVAITDDDCVPQPQWLAAIERCFRDPEVGAVGGRDVVHHSDVVDDGQTPVVGRVTSYGRTIGRHHFESHAQDVAFLKGANMAYRRVALRPFDAALRGSGAQVCNDMAASLAVHRDGWRLRWDPEVRVDHFPAQRFDADGRGEGRSMTALADEQHNDVYVLVRYLPPPRNLAALGYRLVVGSPHAPGVVRGLLFVARGGGGTERRARAHVVLVVLRARLSGCRTAARAGRAR
jgi:glycosyltransferase involved in cell wall biosynthesis